MHQCAVRLGVGLPDCHLVGKKGESRLLEQGEEDHGENHHLELAQEKGLDVERPSSREEEEALGDIQPEGWLHGQQQRPQYAPSLPRATVWG